MLSSWGNYFSLSAFSSPCPISAGTLEEKCFDLKNLFLIAQTAKIVVAKQQTENKTIRMT
jgi:hypothetical protein